MHPRQIAHLQIHFCVLLWGFTAILGTLISLPAAQLVWWRMLLVSLSLLLLPRVWRALGQMPLRQIGIFALIGMVVALHWLTFYAAIKLSNASVGATCMALAPVFLAITEPLLTKRAFRLRELLLGAAVVPGVALVVGAVPSDMHAGIALGALSAFFVAVFAALNKRHIGRGDALTITFIEMSAGALLLTLTAPLLAQGGAAFALPGLRDALLLGVLAFACTLLPFALSLKALHHLSAYTAQLAINLEPVYTILIAIVLLNEHRELSLYFYLGVAIVISAVMLFPLLDRPTTLQSPEQAP